MPNHRPGPDPYEPEQQKRSWAWRFQEDVDFSDAAAREWEERIGSGWLQLQLTHTSFRFIESKDYRELTDRLEAIERLFVDWPDLDEYYRECYAPENASPLYPELRLQPIPEERPRGAKAVTVPERRITMRHVAAIQVQFLEDLFYVLNLERYGNAPDNRGSMNLFRRWGRSPTFNHYLDQLRSTLTLSFLEFYDRYLRYHPCRIDEKPIPHPWDLDERRRDYREDLWRNSGDRPPDPPVGGDPGPCRVPPTEKAKARPDVLLFPGVFLDSGIQQVSPEDPSEPGSTPGEGKAGAKYEQGEHGTGPAEAGGAPPGQSPPPHPTTEGGPAGDAPND